MFLMVLMMIRITMMLIIIKLPGPVTGDCLPMLYQHLGQPPSGCRFLLRTYVLCAFGPPFCVDLRPWIPHRFGQRYCCRVPKKEDSNGSIETPELC